ncbi:MAG: hypothetical protein IJW18_06550 [Lachnospiraceae bacterium]|nr:hypothetical protein [Lachnospiraceae bacterium]
MEKSNLKVTERCVQCGSCLGCGYDFLSSASNGEIIVRIGTFLSEQSLEYKTLKEVCPVDAFEINNIVTSADKKQMIETMIAELKDYKGLEKPTVKDIPFNKDEYHVSIPVASGEYRYDYSSDSAAERAALREFERAMYSQIDSIILKIITEYRVKRIKPYYTVELEEGSVYAKSNQKVSEILAAIKNVMDCELPADFTNVNIYPSNEETGVWKMLNRGELISEEFISEIRSEFDYPSSQYDCYWRTDDMETYAGTDWRGNSKYKYMYCYKDIRGAFEELAKDILNACGYARNDVEERALSKVQWLVDVYNKELRALIDEKLRILEQCRNK